jgi:hypothetical protein
VTPPGFKPDAPVSGATRLPTVTPTGFKPDAVVDWDQFVRDTAEQFNVDPDYALAVARTESRDPVTGRLNPAAVSKAGARGIMQLMPETAARWQANIDDPYENVRAGVQELGQLYGQHGNWETAVRRYNASPQAAKSVTDPYVLRVAEQLPPEKRARLLAGPAAAPVASDEVGAPPPAAPWYKAFDVTTREGQRTWGGAIGGLLGGGLGAPLGPAGAGTAAVLGSMLGGSTAAGLQQAYDYLFAPPPKPGVPPVTPPEDEGALSDVLGAGTTQGIYEMTGQALGIPLTALGRRVVASRVARQAAAGLADSLKALEAGLAKSRTPVTAADVGREAEAVIQGPGRRALKSLGEAVEASTTRESGAPDLPTAPLRERLQQLSESVTPLASHQPSLARTTETLPLEAHVGAAPTRPPGLAWPETESATELWEHALADAKAQGYTGPASRLRQAFDELMQHPSRGARALQAEMTGPHPDLQLLNEIRANGGIGADTVFAGESNWLRQATKGGKIHGVSGVTKKGGLSFEQMAERLRQLPGYERFTSGKELADELTNIVQRGVPQTTMSLSQAANVVGLRSGERWWEPFMAQQQALAPTGATALGPPLPADHPLPAVLARVNEILDQVGDTIRFQDAHKIYRAVNDAVNWQSPARKQVQQLSKGFNATLRQLMSAHEPFNKAAAAYAQAEKLFSKGIPPQLHRAVIADPEAIVTLLKGGKPTRAQMLYDALVTQPTAAGEGARAEQAWDAVRGAWANEHLIKGSIGKLGDRLAKMDPEFERIMYGDPRGQQIIGRLRTIATNLADLQAKAAAFEASSLAGAKGVRETLGETFRDVAHVASSISPHWKLSSAVRLLQGPKSSDLIRWAASSDRATQLFVRAMTSNLPGQAIADLIRLKDVEEENPDLARPVPSHAGQVATAPPRP